MLTPQKGSISVVSGGKKYHIDKYMRPLFAYVPQGNMLMSGTIRDNIKLTNSTATDEEALEAAKISCAYDFINELPSGLDTVLMETAGAVGGADSAPRSCKGCAVGRACYAA